MKLCTAKRNNSESQGEIKYLGRKVSKARQRVVKIDNASTAIRLKQNQNKITARQQWRYKGLI